MSGLRNCLVRAQPPTMKYTIKRQQDDSVHESTIKDSAFQQLLNPPGAKTILDLKWFSNYERLLFSSRQLLDVLLQNKLLPKSALGQGIMQFQTKSNVTFKSRSGSSIVNQEKRVLQSFLLVPEIFNILLQRDVIEEIKELITEVENRCATEEDDEVNNFYEASSTFDLEYENLALGATISSYNATYGENSAENSNLQLELCYVIKSPAKISDEAKKTIKYASVRMPATAYIDYITNAGEGYLQRVQNKYDQLQQSSTRGTSKETPSTKIAKSM